MLSLEEQKGLFVAENKAKLAPVVSWKLNDLSALQLRQGAGTLASLQIYYDLLCPDSRDAHNGLLAALMKQVPE